MIIRAANAADHSAIRGVVTAAFGRSDDADIVERVRTDGAALAELVAELDGEIAGHVLFSRTTCRPPLSVAALGPLAVAPALHGQGIGSALARCGLEACRQLGSRACVVLGAPAYYGRFGFTPAGATIQSRYSVLAAFQALEFESGALGRRLTLAYSSAFD